MTPPLRQGSFRGWRPAAAAALAGHALLFGLWRAGVPPAPLLLGWLGAALVFLGMASGAQAILFIRALTGGRWLEALEPAVSRLARTAPVAALPLIALSCFLPVLFPWAGAVPAEAASIVAKKSLWLNEPFMIARTAAFVAVAALLVRWLRPRPGAGRAAAGLILWLVSVSWLAVDWVMSLSPAWYSTAIGLWLAASFVLSALAGAAGANWLTGIDAGADRRNDVASLMLAAILFWFYISYMQYLVVWSGNLPEEIGWFLARRTAFWEAVAAAMIVSTFALPLAALVFRPVRRSPALLGLAAASVVLGRVLESAWQVQPAAAAGAWSLAAAALGALAGLGGLFAIAVTGGVTAPSGARR